MPDFRFEPGWRVFGRRTDDGMLGPVQGSCGNHPLWWVWRDNAAYWIDERGLIFSISHLDLRHAYKFWELLPMDEWIDEGL